MRCIRLRRFNDPPAADVGGGHLHDADDRHVLAPRHVRHLLHHRHFGVDEIVGEDHRERLVADDGRRAQHGVAQSERFGLTDVDAVDAGWGGRLNGLEQLGLVAQRELGLELVGLVEVILDRPLVASGDEDHVGDAGRRGLLHRILDERLVDHRQHFLGARLGRRQEAAAETGHRENGFGDFFHV
jgi:hypothetical protein